jgi:NADH-quinone oxidoreductase subunit C
MRIEEVMEKIKEKFGLEVENPYPRRLRVKISKDSGSEEERRQLLKDILSYAKNELEFQHMSFITCVDFIKDGIFDLNYGLWSYTIPTMLVIKYELDRDNPKHITVVDMWKPAKTWEQEVHEMFGVEFEGNPRSFEPYVLEDWDDIPPLRKDFDPVKYLQEHPMQGAGYDPLPYVNLVEKKLDAPIQEETGGDEGANS